MEATSPLQLTLLIVLGLAALGILISGLRNLRTLSGYKLLGEDSRQIAKALHGEIFKDGGDLVISGEYLGATTYVRFSNLETTPGMVIHMAAPATFSLQVTAANAPRVESWATVYTKDTRFDARFVTRTSQPAEAAMLLGRGAMEWVRKLCCSSQTSLAIAPGNIELSELMIPGMDAAEHILGHVEAMHKLSAQLRAMPGSEKVVLPPVKRERQVVGRVAIAAGMMMALASVIAASYPREEVVDVAAKFAPGLMPADAMLMGRTEGWRVAAAGDFDEGAVAWLRSKDQEPAGRLAGNFSGQEQSEDVCYVLVRSDGTYRVVMLAGKANRYDNQFPKIQLAARVPRGAVDGIKWRGTGVTGEEVGDGLLLVRDVRDPGSAVVLFVSPKRIVAAVPENYANINFY